MKAAVFHGKHDMRIEEIPVPVIREDQVLVQVKACGICGTDVHIFNGEKGAAECVPPTVLGHEFSGVIAKVGANVKSVAVGDRVCVDPNGPCGQCYYCKSGKVHFCEDMTATGTKHNGGFAEYCAVNEKSIYKISDGLSFEEAAMGEPVSCCLHGIDLCDIQQGTDVMIIGGGPIGLITLQLVKISGAANIILLEPVEEKRKLAQTLGATVVIDPLHEDVKQVLADKGIHHIQTVIECAGRTETMMDAIDYAGNTATVMLFGLTGPDDEIAVKPYDVFRKELKITASFINPNTMGRSVALLESGMIDVKPLIVRKEALDAVAELIISGESQRNGKTVILP